MNRLLKKMQKDETKIFRLYKNPNNHVDFQM